MGGMDLLAWICNRASPPWKLSEDKAADVSFIIIIDKAKDIYNVNNIPSTQYLNACSKSYFMKRIGQHSCYCYPDITNHLFIERLRRLHNTSSYYSYIATSITIKNYRIPLNIKFNNLIKIYIHI
ncbi:unnamed protein product [Rhizophagus irregularis]|nr:unnamed protein product [Rhizophagus irregularis]